MGHAVREKSIIDKSAAETAGDVAAGEKVADITLEVVNDAKEPKNKVGEVTDVANGVTSDANSKRSGTINPPCGTPGGNGADTPGNPPGNSVKGNALGSSTVGPAVVVPSIPGCPGRSGKTVGVTPGTTSTGNNLNT